MKCLFLHLDNFHCEIMFNEKSKKMHLDDNQINQFENENCLVGYICFEENDKFLDFDFVVNEILKVCAITKVNKLIIFPFAHLSSSLLNIEDSIFLLDYLVKRIKKKIIHSISGLEIMQIPFGYDKKFSMETKGHSFNVMFREFSGNMYNVYDRAILSHSEYNEMTNVMLDFISGTVLEVGSGTGLFTKKITEKGNNLLFCIEPDTNFYKQFKVNLPSISIERFGGENYKSTNSFDCITMCLVLHHIKDNGKLNFLKNLRENLKENGTIIVGDVFLPKYINSVGWKESLNKYHNYRLRKAKDKEPFVGYIEKQALLDGLNKNGEYKISLEIAIDLFEKVGFSEIRSIPIQSQEYGGYNIIIAKK